MDLDSIKIQYQSKGIKVKPGEGGEFVPGDEIPGETSKEFFEPLSEIIKEINERFATDFNDTDKVVADMLLARLSMDAEFEEEVKKNPKDNVYWAFERKFNIELQAMLEENFDFYKKLNNDNEIKIAIMKEMFLTLYEKMKKKAS